MALPATDVFTGTNGTAITSYSANWTLNSGNFQINTNAISPNSNNNECGAHWNADAFNADQYAQLTLTALTSAVQIGPGVRMHASADTYYGFYTDGVAYTQVVKMVGGTWTSLAESGPHGSVGQVWRIEVSGTTITPIVNGSTHAMGAVTDSSISSGSAGIIGFHTGTGTRGDDWEGGNLGGTPPPTAVLPFRALLGVGI